MPGSVSEPSPTADPEGGGFHQDPPRLGNQYDEDAFLGEYLERVLPDEVRDDIRGELRDLGDLGAALHVRQLEDRENEPRLTQWDAWGRRVDAIELTPLWREARRLAAERGLVAIAYERRHAEFSRVHQFVANYLVQASLDFYSCPLAMTDGAARTLLDLGASELAARAVPRLTSRDPEAAWTSGQWMTERTGGSDVGLSETVARSSADGWRLYGTKWFTSAATSEMAITLARPDGNPAGSRGLALFYLETRGGDGRLQGIRVNRLKDKLGTRKVPTAEVTLDGALATPVRGLDDGVRNITPMLTVTRVWNAAGAAWLRRRGIALARDYARRRTHFGARLSEKPLHVDTLAGLEAETRGAFLLAFRAVEALGRREATGGEAPLLRALTPVAKLTTARQAVAVLSEAVEAFGGAGYVEDTGLPGLLRDAQVLPIWEGTTNVLSLDTLRALGTDGALEAFSAEIESRCAPEGEGPLAREAEAARAARDRALAWLAAARDDGARLEAGARRFALTLGRALELALLVEHARWCVGRGGGRTAVAAARRFARNGVDLVAADDGLDDSRLLFDQGSV
jgi:alkylation response protein AidB-like acyl-CoA dehydrogenase